MKWILHFLTQYIHVISQTKHHVIWNKCMSCKLNVWQKETITGPRTMHWSILAEVPNSLQPLFFCFCLLDGHLKKKICKDKIQFNSCISNLPLYWNLWSFGNEFHKYDGTAQGLHNYYLGLSARCPVYEKNILEW